MNGNVNEAARWTEWAHQQPAIVKLPCGREVAQDCGAEHGDPFGSAQASMAMGDKAQIARTQVEEADLGRREGEGSGTSDE